MRDRHTIQPRTQLLRTALFACLGAGSLLPLCWEDPSPKPPTISMHSHRPAEIVSRTSPVSIRALARDPFARELETQATPSAIIGGANDVPPRAFTVVAVATGVAAHALVSQDGATRLVSAGDRLNGIRIASVVPAGVRLDDGTFIGLEARP